MSDIRMRVMVLGLRGFPNVQGGVEKHAEHLYPLLVQLGCQVEVIVRSPYVPKSQKSWEGIIFHRLWAPRLRGIEAFTHSVVGVLYAAVNRPDLLHIHAVGPAIVTPIARLLKLHVVVTHHGPDYDREKWGYMARWLLRLGEKWGMQYANERIVISNVISELVKNKYHVEAVIIPNGISLPIIPVTTLTLKKYNLEKGRYVMLVSRFVPEKRHLDLIYAFNESNIQGWKLVLVGKADHPNEYSRRVILEASKSPNIILTGYQDGVPLAELYANAGLFVLPSSHEGLPIALLEAMSYGLPVLASNIPANLEVGLYEENYFPLGDIYYLANLLKQYMSTTNAENYNYRNRKLVTDKYDWNKIATKTLATFQQVLYVDI